MDTQDTFTAAEIEQDLKTPLPRGAGAEAPQSQILDGDMPLLYTEQNFNALASANAAMQTEISSLNTQISFMTDTHKSQLTDLQLALENMRVVVKDMSAELREQRKATEAATAELKEARAEVEYQRENGAALQRKLDRSLGYLDRVIDDQERYADAPTVPAPRSPVGPDLGSIPAARRFRERDIFEPGATIRSFHPEERPRRY